MQSSIAIITLNYSFKTVMRKELLSGFGQPRSLNILSSAPVLVLKPLYFIKIIINYSQAEVKLVL